MNRTIPDFLKSFLGVAKISITDNGIYPHIVVYEDQTEQTTICAMDLDPGELFLNIAKILVDKKPIQLIYSIDRENKPNQGVDEKYESVLTIGYFALNQWSFHVMPYNTKDDIGEVQSDNDWWNQILKKELKQIGIIGPELTDPILGSAYQEKISITSLHRNIFGAPLYEGIINKDKLSEKVQKYLDEKSLDINNRKSIIANLTASGNPFEFVSEDHGYWTLKAGNGIFPARSSKTKVYLEGVESVIENLN